MTKQEYLLVKLMEECAEVSQRAAKALRFGMQATQKGQELTNEQRLNDELEDLHVVIAMLRDTGLLVPPMAFGWDPAAKNARVLKYMEYSKGIGTLNE